MSFQQKGVILKIFATERVSDKFRKRSLWLQTEEQYPQTINFELAQDRCDILDNFAEGQNVTVHFDLRGRLWDSPTKGQMVFNTLNVWKIQINNGFTDVPIQSRTNHAQTSAVTTNDTFSEHTATHTDPFTDSNDNGNDLPF